MTHTFVVACVNRGCPRECNAEVDGNRVTLAEGWTIVQGSLFASCLIVLCPKCDVSPTYPRPPQEPPEKFRTPCKHCGKLWGTHCGELCMGDPFPGTKFTI